MSRSNTRVVGVHVASPRSPDRPSPIQPARLRFPACGSTLRPSPSHSARTGAPTAKRPRRHKPALWAAPAGAAAGPRTHRRPSRSSAMGRCVTAPAGPARRQITGWRRTVVIDRMRQLEHSRVSRAALRAGPANQMCSTNSLRLRRRHHRLPGFIAPSLGPPGRDPSGERACEWTSGWAGVTRS